MESSRQVSYEEADALSKSFGCKYMETSAKTRVNVEEAFHELVRQVRIAAGETAAPARDPSTPDARRKKKGCALL